MPQLTLDLKNLERILRDIKKYPALRAKIKAMAMKRRGFFGGHAKFPTYMELTVLSASLPPSEAQLVLALAVELQNARYGIYKLVVDIAEGATSVRSKDLVTNVIGQTVHVILD